MDPRRLPLSLWDASPTILIAALFTFVAVINWDYQLKFFQPFHDHGQLNYYLGPELLVTGFALSLLSSLSFHFMRRARFSDAHGYRIDWARAIFLGFITLVLFLMSLSVIVLSPAAITMKEQMQQVP